MPADRIRFDLDTALAAWRRSLAHNRAVTPEDLDELEQHLRDQIDALVAEGCDAGEAFHRALGEMGAHGAAEAEYRKVYWGKLRRHGAFRAELAWRLAMLRSYLTVVGRQLGRQKVFTILNAVGLAIGMATCLVIGLFVRHELSYDRFHPNAEQVYRVIQAPIPGHPIFADLANARVPPGLAAPLEGAVPVFEHATLVTRPRRGLFALDGERFYLQGVVRADSAFLDVFPFEVLEGNPETVLARPNQMVVTRSLARRLFGDRDPMGQVLTYENRDDYVVAGILEDVPSNAHFRFEVLLSLTEADRRDRYDSEIVWTHHGDYLYVVVPPGADRDNLAAQLREAEVALGQPHEPQLELQPLTDIHLSRTANEIGDPERIESLYLFSAIGVLILLIAGINYVNLTTARFTKRAREVGIRKVVGAHRVQLITQFLSESVVLVLLALPLGLGLAGLVLPFVNALTGLQLRLVILADGVVPPVLAGFVLLVGLAAGLYPAVFLSRYRPALVLKGMAPGGGRLLRKGLVVFQFAASVVLIIGAFVVRDQLTYIRHRDLGFDREHVLWFWGQRLGDQYAAFVDRLQAESAVAAVASGSPAGIGLKSVSDEVSDTVDWLNGMVVGYDYFETLGLEVLAGRTFLRTNPTDADEGVVLTRAAARYYGIDADPIGQQVEVSGERRTVLGVVEDFNNESLRNAVQPYLFTLQTDNNDLPVLIRLGAGDVAAGVAAVERVWNEFVPDRPFTFTFLEDDIEALYRAEERLGRLFGLFSGLAVVVACLGLFGLAAFTAEQRRKEIGIRKVLGATLPGIVLLLSKEFTRLVAIGFLVAVPVAFLVARRWLEGFAYRIDLGGGPFVLAGLLLLGIALLTVSVQSLRAARTDPAKTLRYE